MKSKTELPTGFQIELTWTDAHELVHFWRHYKGKVGAHFAEEQDAISDAWAAFPLIQREMNNENVIQWHQLKVK